MTLLLSARDVRFRHPGAASFAVAGVSVDVSAGEVVGLVGPNAAGKSTLARICCGLLAPASGRVELGGAAVAQLSARERARRVAFLPQSQPADLAFTAREIVLMGRAPHLGFWSLEGEADLRRADEALQEADALSLADRPVSQLSGGERQRVWLARAFAQDAALLVLDEPTSALDLAHQVLVATALRRAARAGRGALLVLHDLALAGAACDRLLLLVAGALRAEGAPAEVLRPDVLSAAYDTAVDVVIDPATGLPLVAPRIGG